MENSLILKVSQIKVLFRILKIFHYHLVIISCNCIMNRQVTIIVFGI